VLEKTSKKKKRNNQSCIFLNQPRFTEENEVLKVLSPPKLARISQAQNYVPEYKKQLANEEIKQKAEQKIWTIDR